MFNICLQNRIGVRLFHLQSSFKLYNVRYAAEFCKKISFIEQLFFEHISTKSKNRLEIFKRFAFYNELIVKGGLVLYCGGVMAFFPYPIYMYICRNEMVPLMPLHTPVIDDTTPSGYITLLVIHLFLISIGVVGMSACDVFYTVMISNVPIMARLIEDETNQLNESLERNPSEGMWKCQFRNIILMHQEMTM